MDLLSLKSKYNSRSTSRNCHHTKRRHFHWDINRMTEPDDHHTKHEILNMSILHWTTHIDLSSLLQFHLGYYMDQLASQYISICNNGLKHTILSSCTIHHYSYQCICPLP